MFSLCMADDPPRLVVLEKQDRNKSESDPADGACDLEYSGSLKEYR